LFLLNGNRVFGVEPNAQMRAQAEHSLRDHARFSSVDAAAESTTIPDHSVDFVVAASALHWFDAVPTKNEFRRILRKPGWVAVLGNTRAKH
jgi:ubiquinone/menaquinone biosynthesis C-methylase UbiE